MNDAAGFGKKLMEEIKAKRGGAIIFDTVAYVAGARVRVDAIGTGAVVGAGVADTVVDVGSAINSAGAPCPTLACNCMGLDVVRVRGMFVCLFG